MIFNDSVGYYVFIDFVFSYCIQYSCRRMCAMVCYTYSVPKIFAVRLLYNATWTFNDFGSGIVINLTEMNKRERTSKSWTKKMYIKRRKNFYQNSASHAPFLKEKKCRHLTCLNTFIGLSAIHAVHNLSFVVLLQVFYFLILSRYQSVYLLYTLCSFVDFSNRHHRNGWTWDLLPLVQIYIYDLHRYPF